MAWVLAATWMGATGDDPESALRFPYTHERPPEVGMRRPVILAAVCDHGELGFSKGS